MNQTDLQILLHSDTSLIVVETYDELRALNLLSSAFRQEKLAAWYWTHTDALQPLGFGLQMDSNSQLAEPDQVLSHIKQQQQAAAFVLCDLHPFLTDPKIIRLLKDIALNQQAAAHKVVLLSYRLQLPPELSRYAASLPMSLPSQEEIMAIIRDEAKQWSKANDNARIKTDNATLERLVNNLKGLPHQDVRRLAHGAIADDGAISESDLPGVTKTKFALMDMDGVLHFEYATAGLADVAGLSGLKQWLQERRKVILQHEGSAGMDAPKGVLLFGVQGGGKSLAAKAIAGIWGLPLLRLDLAALFNKYVGETERNLREALQLADTMAPCVLWVDELEKGLAQDDANGAVAKRLLGTLLTWMSERKTPVFMVATSNDISQLPPELLRKGRFDEIFFVDLPDTQVRTAIFDIHLRRRGYDSTAFDLRALAEAADGFTGAEVEQAVVSATYSALAQDEPLGQKHLHLAIVKTQPLSVVMSEKVQQLRLWARERAVHAG